MAREIRFRAWHKAEEKMCEVNLLRPGVGAFLVGLIEEAEQIVNLDDKQYLVTPRDWTPGRFCDVAEFELMQFTGLHDKNGREIYEGDILESDSFVDTFSWTDGGYTFDRDTKDEVMTVHYPYEVIGNIYETPNLISTNHG